MLWSMQLELPDSPGVTKKRPPRERSLTLMKRNSYATLIVEESLEQIEQDKKAMAAALVSKRRGSESSPSLVQLHGREKETKEADKEEKVTDDSFDVSNRHYELFFYTNYHNHIHGCDNEGFYINFDDFGKYLEI